MLEHFAGLCDASGEKIRRFTARWGVTEHQVEIIDAEEQQEPVAGCRVIGAHR